MRPRSYKAEYCSGQALNPNQVRINGRTSRFLAAMLFSMPFTCASASASSRFTVVPELLESWQPPRPSSSSSQRSSHPVCTHMQAVLVQRVQKTVRFHPWGRQ